MAKRLTATKLGILYCFSHFAVEVACFYYLYSHVSIGNLWWIIALLYDALAFLPQNTLGIIADKFNKIPFGVIGFIMVTTALFLPFGWFSVTIIALGNALIHVDGAEKTLLNSGGKITPNAIFVGGGSFGVITGRLLGGISSKLILIIPVALCVLFLVLILIFTHLNGFTTSVFQPNATKFPSVTNPKMPNGLLVFIIMFAVAVRGYIGYAVPTSWSVTNLHLIILYSYMGFGKMLGGVIVDKLGYKKATIISIVGALPFLLFGNTLPILSLTGVLLYSASMPITVGIIYSRFTKSPGFAFGITTIGLFFGSAPEFFITLPNLQAQQIVVTLLSVIALTLILLCLKQEEKNA